MKKTVLTLLFFALAVGAFAQLRSGDSTRVIPDTVEIESYATRFNPREAALYAAVLPGLGQIYNKKYWKLPLVYGGFIGFGYGLNFYQKGYTKYKGELFDVLETGDDFSESGFTEDQLRNIVDQYRRERDFFIILMAGMYLLQIVDAHVDAHLKEFDLNPNLHVRIQPTWESDMMTGRSAGISLKFRF
jgi:hypothetical protein